MWRRYVQLHTRIGIATLWFGRHKPRPTVQPKPLRHTDPSSSDPLSPSCVNGKKRCRGRGARGEFRNCFILLLILSFHKILDSINVTSLERVHACRQSGQTSANIRSRNGGQPKQLPLFTVTHSNFSRRKRALARRAQFGGYRQWVGRIRKILLGQQDRESPAWITAILTCTSQTARRNIYAPSTKRPVPRNQENRQYV